MWNILSRLMLVVIILLLVPTGLILASQNSIPGDKTYPVKRGIEGVLQNLFSLNPITRAYFKTDLSNRRFKEAIVLLKRNSTDKTMANTSLIEMLSAAAVASSDINKISDPVLKKRLSDDLSNQITNYRQSLLTVAKEKNQTPANISSTPTPTVILQQPSSAPSPTSTLLTPTQTLAQTPTPSPTPVKTCNNTTINYSQCGGASGYETYPKTHLLMIAEYINSCTGLTRKVVINDWNLNIDCDPEMIGQCSADNISACVDMLDKLQRGVSNSRSANPNPQSTAAFGADPKITPTPTPTPTKTRVKVRNVFDRLYERSGFDTKQSTPSATSSATPTVASESGTVQGISIKKIENSVLQNLLNSVKVILISIFK